MLKLPTITYEQLKNIIMNCEKMDNKTPIERDELAIKTGLNSDTISRNNGFLFSTGIIEKDENNKNIITDIGIKLAKAYKQENEINIRESLLYIINNNNDLKELIYSQQYKKNLTIDNFSNIIIKYCSQENGNYSKIGANTLIEIFKDSGLISEDNNIISFNPNNIDNISNNKNIISDNIPLEEYDCNDYSLNININITYDFNRNPDEIINTIKYITKKLNIKNNKINNININNNKNEKLENQKEELNTKKNKKKKIANRNEFLFIDIDKEFGEDKIEEWINFYKNLNINSAISSVLVTVYWIEQNINNLKNRITNDYIYSFLLLATNNNIKFNVFDAIGNSSRSSKKFIQKNEEGMIEITGIGKREVENNILNNKE